MCGAGDAWVVGADQHLEVDFYLLLAPVEQGWRERFHILLDVVVVLVGRDNTVDLGAYTLSLYV